MKTYEVEFSLVIEVEAEDIEEAQNKAIDLVKFADPDLIFNEEQFAWTGCIARELDEEGNYVSPPYWRKSERNLPSV